MKGESDRFSVWPTGQHHHGAKGRTVVDMAVDMTMGAGQVCFLLELASRYGRSTYEIGRSHAMRNAA